MGRRRRFCYLIITEQIYLFLSRNASQHAFFLDLVLMREVGNLLVEMPVGLGDVSYTSILNGKSGRSIIIIAIILQKLTWDQSEENTELNVDQSSN